MTKWNDFNFGMKADGRTIHYSSGMLMKRSKRSIPFVPGLMLVLLGATVLLAPRLIFYALGILLVFLGVLFWAVAWKVMQLRQKFIAIQKNLDSRIEVHQVRMRQAPIEVEEDPDVKITFH